MEEYRFLDKFTGLPNIPGLVGNVIFYVHGVGGDDKSLQDQETGNSVRSKKLREASENFELDLAGEICRHLVLNQVDIEALQILIPYESRTEIISDKLYVNGTGDFRTIPVYHVEQSSIPMADVNIILLADKNYRRTPAHENILVDTIHAGILHSKVGCIIMGGHELISFAGDGLWKAFVSEMYHRRIIVPFFTIQCKPHGMICSHIEKAVDFRHSSPMGGCLTICNYKSCGHFCGSVCHPFVIDHDEGDYVCMEDCKNICENGHQCEMHCSEQCACLHRCKFQRSCGHPQDNNQRCGYPCDTVLKCGHVCETSCSECDKNHDEIPCKQKCIKICERGHQCPTAHTCDAPCPPCSKVTMTTLACHHQICRPCYEPDIEEDSYKCKEECNRTYPLCNHKCDKLCFEECGVCEKPYPRRHPQCGHVVNAPCHTPINLDCWKMVPSSSVSHCGHKVQVPCCKNSKLTSELVSHYCNKNCETLLNIGKGDCGHYCYGSCWDCYQGRFHIRCSYVCGKKLICGHDCRVSCPLVCPPCTMSCPLSCEHYQCPYECGTPCDYVCSEPCPYSCPHLKCGKKCGEVCTHEGCNEPCDKKLRCGHNCIGFCGEECPDLCRICDVQELLKGIFSGESWIDEEFRFVYLPSCGHTIEEGSLTAWVGVQDDDGEIQPKCCPLCLQPLGLTLRRYSAQIRASLKNVNEVKTKIFGDPEEIQAIVETTMAKIINKLESDVITPRFPNFAETMLNELSKPIKSSEMCGTSFSSMFLHKAMFIEWVCAVWETAEDVLSLSEHLWSQTYFRSLESVYDEIFKMIADREWPLHPNEISSIRRELFRAQDMELLYSRLSLEQEDHVLKLACSREGRDKFDETEEVLLKMVPYETNQRQKFRERFSIFMTVISYTLEISDNERKEIIRAFGARAGRWFKCPNGHVYVVTECGGVTQFGKCNECGETIGGQNHMLLQSNALASEIDGAKVSMYPTALSRPRQ